MTDQELLTYAAKAAGIGIDIIPCDDNNFSCYHSGCGVTWNPLKDNADAFQLMVKLRMKVDFNQTRCYAQVPSVTKLIDAYNNDHFKAARQAITECAAEIGKGM